MYMVIIVSNNVYLKFAKRIDFKCSYHKKANIFKCIVKDFGFYVMINIICIFYGDSEIIKTDSCNGLNCICPSSS